MIEPNSPISESVAVLKRRAAPVEVQKISITGGKHGNRVLAAQTNLESERALGGGGGGGVLITGPQTPRAGETR